MSICLLFLFLSVSEAEPLDLGSQANAWEPVISVPRLMPGNQLKAIISFAIASFDSQ